MKPAHRAERLAFEAGIKETAETLKTWQEGRWKVAVPWMGISLLIALVMFGGAWSVATFLPQTTEAILPIFVTAGNRIEDALWLLGRNSMVLLLHLLVCVAAYLARRSVPMQAQHTAGINRWVHQRAGGIAMLVVAGLTAYSLSWQTWQLGNVLHSASDTLGLTPLDLLSRAALHGIPELAAVFLPLAACLILGAKKQWNQMLAAAFLCAIIAIPILIAASVIETWVTHGLF